METTSNILCDSVNSNNKRITTFLLEYPRIIHAEHLRHRSQSFSVASSRAIPCEQQLKQVLTNPFVPIKFQKQHKGMQGDKYFLDEKNNNTYDLSHDDMVSDWKLASEEAYYRANLLNENKLTKQLVNRIIEPFLYCKVVCTATEWDNFFELRHPWHYDEHDNVIWEDEPNLNFPAEIHIQDLAIKMKKSMTNSIPIKLKENKWHLPFITLDDEKEALTLSLKELDIENMNTLFIKLSAARCAMTSYNKNQGKNIETELKLANRLLKEKHLSPYEHQALSMNMDDDKLNWSETNIGWTHQTKNGNLWSNNFQGWIQARAFFSKDNND